MQTLECSAAAEERQVHGVISWFAKSSALYFLSDGTRSRSAFPILWPPSWARTFWHRTLPHLSPTMLRQSLSLSFATCLGPYVLARFWYKLLSVQIWKSKTLENSTLYIQLELKNRPFLGFCIHDRQFRMWSKLWLVSKTGGISRCCW